MSTFHRSIRYHRRPHHDVFAVSTFLSPLLWIYLVLMGNGNAGGLTCSFFSPSCLELTLRR